MSDAFADWDGAYVLGSLSADERRRYEEHLAGCDACSRAVQELVGLPGILGKLGTAEAVAIRDASDEAQEEAGRLHAHSPARAALVAARVRRRRRRARGLVALALAAVLAIGSLAGWAAASIGDPTVHLASAEELHPVDGSHLTAVLSVTPVGWGTRFDWSCVYLGTPPSSAPRYPGAVSYSLVVHTKTGGSVTVATWTSAGGEAKHLVAATAIPAASIAGIDIRVTGSDRPLARTSS